MPFTVEQLFAIFRDYNEAVWPAQAALAALGLLAAGLAGLGLAFAPHCRAAAESMAVGVTGAGASAGAAVSVAGVSVLEQAAIARIAVTRARRFMGFSYCCWEPSRTLLASHAFEVRSSLGRLS